MSAPRSGIGATSSAVPFNIPLHFNTVSGAAKPQGPSVPLGWRDRWHRSATSTHRPTTIDQAGSDDLDPWPDLGLKRWVTCMTAWDVEGELSTAADDTTNAILDDGVALAPRIAIEDEQGEEISGDRQPSSPRRPRVTLGDRKGGRRIALGMQDGSIWILQESQSEKQDTSIQDLPRSPSQSSNLSFGHRSASRSSLALVSPTSTTNVFMNGNSRHADREAVTSSTMAVAGRSEVMASANPIRGTGEMDAEEKLEKQWHAGREGQSMMSGMMEALGIQHGNNSHDHIHSTHDHPRSSSQATASPTSRRSNVERKSLVQRDSFNNTQGTRSRTASGVSDRAGEGGKDLRSSLAEAGLMGAIGLGGGRRAAGGAGIPAEESVARNGAASPPNLSVLTARKVAQEEPILQRDLKPVEPLLALQSPSISPVASLRVSKDRSGREMLCVVQEDGRTTLWTLGETLSMHAIDLKTARVPLIDADMPRTQTNIGSSPLARLTALRSATASPQPRSRVNSNPSHPDAVSPQVVSRFEAVQVIQPKGSPSSASLLACYDKTKMRLHIIDFARSVLVAQQKLSDVSFSAPCVQVLAGGDAVEILYIGGAGALFAETIRIKKKVNNNAHTDSKLAPFSSASAFLRREGISHPSSRPASIMEEPTDERRDLGDTGLERSPVGLLLLPDELVLTWSKRGISLAKRMTDSLVVSDTVELSGIERVVSSGDYILVQLATAIKKFDLNPQGQLVNSDDFDFLSCEVAFALPSCACPLLCLRDEQDQLVLKAGHTIIWQGERASEDESSILASLPFSLERIVLSLASGHLVICSLSDLVTGQLPKPFDSTPKHTGTVTLLQTVTNPRTNAKHIFGGTEEGDIIVWDATTLAKQTQRSLLTSPLIGFIVLGDRENALRLYGCVACVAADGTIAIMVLDGLRELYLIPGRDAPLEMMAVRSNELLTVYGDGRARVWDMSSLELRRSVGVDQALALLEDGKGWWAQFPIDVEHLKREKGNAGVMASIPTSRAHTAGAMTADIRRVVDAAGRMVAPLNTSGVNHARELRQAADVDAVDDNSDPLLSLGARSAPKASASVSITMPQAKKALHTLRPLLQCLLPVGLSKEGDEYCKKVLDLAQSELPVSVTSGVFADPGYMAMSIHAAAPGHSWCISSALTTTRLVALIAMLMVLSNIAELQETTHELIVLLGSLTTAVGDAFHHPTMDILTDFLTDHVSAIKQAAQMLFVSSLDDMPAEELDAICAQFSHELPTRRQTDPSAAEQDDERDAHSSKALLLLGLIATQRYTVMPPTLLKDIALSISLYLNDEQNAAHQSIAIVLCDRGFSIFQHYFDAMEIVRTLFSLSTLAQESSNSSSADSVGRPAATPAAIENRDLARQATLRIAEENTPLFMTTLSLDILHARSPAHCSATMRLVAFMVRRKPLVLYPNLPRLAEAVVKSLDPTVTTLRTVIHRSATIIISELVATYPTIAFHKGSQRLAVGTFEGAIIMYDLKTATRLYVLEAHAASLNGLIFSSDGRRLVSICLGDGMVKVWKTGAGIGSLFNFGGAPRQMSALLGRATGAEPTNGASSAGIGAEAIKQGGTPPYKSFDFGRMAGSALAAVRLAIRSPKTQQQQYSPHGHNERTQQEEEALMTDLDLVRFEWQAERSIKIRVGEASLVFDVA